MTDFPVLEAVGKLEPGIYVVTARPWKGASNPADANAEESVQLAAQWMVVSDLGLTAISGDDGVHALVQSLGSAGPLAGVELRLVARNNEVLATKTTGADGRVDFDPGLSRGQVAARRRDFWSPRSPATTASSASLRMPSTLAIAASPAAIRPLDSTRSSTPSAASIARARPCSPPRFCATPRAWRNQACR